MILQYLSNFETSAAFSFGTVEMHSLGDCNVVVHSCFGLSCFPGNHLSKAATFSHSSADGRATVKQ